MADSVGGSIFPKTNIQEGHIHFNKDQNTLHVYSGGDPANDANWSVVGAGAGVEVGVGNIIAGTPISQAAPVSGTVYTVAHGLGAIPTLISSYYQCITAELGYSVGDRVQEGAFASSNAAADGYTIEYDSVNIRVLVAQNAPIVVLNRTTPALYVLGTSANWRIVAQPYLIT